MKTRIFFALTVLILALSLAPKLSAEPPSPPYSYVLMEGGTATLLYAENGEQQVPAHHCAKLMTLLLTARAVEQGSLTLETKLKTSPHANSMQGAQIWLMAGEEIAVSELILAITVGNANDACVVLAEAVGGTEEKFTALMNAAAEQLGMVGTFYADCTGISPDSVTTACDAAILASELTKFDFLREPLTTWITSVRGGKTELVSTNRLILSYEGIIGTKAYYSDSLGNCVIAAAERDGLIIVCVIFGEEDEFKRFTTAKEKLNAGFSAYTLYTPRKKDIITEPVPVEDGVNTEVETRLGELTPFIIRKSLADKVEISVEYLSDIKAPLSEGDKVGRAVYTVDGEEVYSCAIVAGDGVKKMNFWTAMRKILRAIIKM